MDSLLAEQVAYYRAAAAEYEDHALTQVGQAKDELIAALDAFRPAGSVPSSPAARARGQDNCSGMRRA